jgi:signal transduction histidine kinase
MVRKHSDKDFLVAISGFNIKYKMWISLKTKIWLSICSIVFIFTFFSFYYFPRQQEKLLVDNYNSEIQNLSNTVALGVKIALKEQNFEGVQMAMEFVKDDSRLQFVSMMSYDTIREPGKSGFKLKKTIITTVPQDHQPDPEAVSSDSVIIKKAEFNTKTMSGAILLGFNTKEIANNKRRIMITALVVSIEVFLVGILIGFLLAKHISKPVEALRNAAEKVGEGDLDQKILSINRDEIGDLSIAFNKMIDDLARARAELNDKNIILVNTNNTLNNTMVELKETHAQLVQSEKMASLGELTAGIAHEIQNPLNFVNNFSELNAELIDELKEEIVKGNFEEVDAIANDIKQNEQKINHHGKRADSIVKGMLQHSRNSTGLKELTDINTLADEFLRLSYHGLRAKDKSFNATMNTEFDPSIGKFNIVAQDIGRVVLNLITNAFHAVREKKVQQPEGYSPTVTVITEKRGDKVVLIVRDNGNGVPAKILDKIFQPFFTTKPTGQGTGLGLSMSYDIITKGHDGDLQVKTVEGEGSDFIITLPFLV